MSRKKSRRRDKIAGALGAVNEKFSTNEDPRDNNIGDLEEQMDNQMIQGLENMNPTSQKSFAKQKKSYKHLR